MQNKALFLDSNAHQPVHPKALQAFIDFNSSSAAFGHPSALNASGRSAAAKLEEAREKIAQLLGAKSANQIVFTNSCSQACDWGLKIFFNIEKYIKEEIAVSPLEHPAVGKICEIENIQKLDCTSDGFTILPFSKRIKKVICLHIQNEIGTIQQIKYLKQKYLFSDLSQSIGKMPINLTELDVDVGTMGAHKWGGFGGVGVLYLKDTSWWQPYNQQIGRYLDRPGTLNVAEICASAVALEEAVATLPERTEKMQSFQETLELELIKMGFEIIGKNAIIPTRSKGTTFAAGFKFAQKTVLDLSAKDIYVGTGSACSSYNSLTAIPLMTALGKDYTLNQVLRISQSGSYDDKDAIYFINKLKEVL